MFIRSLDIIAAEDELDFLRFLSQCKRQALQQWSTNCANRTGYPYLACDTGTGWSISRFPIKKFHNLICSVFLNFCVLRKKCAFLKPIFRGNFLTFSHSPPHVVQVRKNCNPSPISRPPVWCNTVYNKKMLYNFKAKKLFVGHRVYACVYQLSLIDLNQRRFIRFVQANS